MKPDVAEAIAVKALGWLASNDDLMPVFLGASGLSVDELRSAATDPGFLVSVLDFVMMDDNWVLEFANAAGIGPEVPMQARAALPGGEQVHWT